MKDVFDKIKIKKRTALTARFVTQVAVMSGMLTALKFALSFIPNIEVVTLLIAVFSTVWGVGYSLPAVVVFCLTEMAIYGIGNWLLLYFIYWPLLALVFHFSLKGKTSGKALVLATVFGVLFSFVFGVLSACTETLLVTSSVAKDNLATYFVSFYVKGLWFDLLHCVSVGVSMIVLYLPLVKVGRTVRRGLAHTRHQEDEDVYVRETKKEADVNSEWEEK